MKNIHLLTTDQPTGIFKSNSGLIFSIIDKVRDNSEGVHIYITSNEVIKDVRPVKGRWHLEKGQILNKFPDYLTDLSECELVIFTTDPNLIEDGVQQINLDFFKWFQDNQECDHVEIKKEMYMPQSNGKISDGKIAFEVCMDPSYNTLPYYTIVIPTKDLTYWRNNCEEDYMHTPISVLKYISELETALNIEV